MAETRSIPKPTSVMGIIIGAINPRMLFLSVACVLAGTGAAALRGNMELLPATLCLIFAMLSQMAGSSWYFYNELKQRHEDFDDDDSPEENSLDTIPSTIVLRETTIGLLIMDAIISLAMLTMAGLWAIVIGVAVAVTVFFTFGGPRPLVRSPWGLMATFILFGPISIIGTTLMQSGHEANTLLNLYDLAPALYISVVMGLMAVNCNMVYDVYSMERDSRHGRRTLPMRKSMKPVKTLFFVNGFVWTAATALLCIVQNLPDWWMYLLVPVIVLIVNCMVGARLGEGKVSYAKMQGAVNINILVMGAAILITAIFVGAADDSALILF